MHDAQSKTITLPRVLLQQALSISCHLFQFSTTGSQQLQSSVRWVLWSWLTCQRCNWACKPVRIGTA